MTTMIDSKSQNYLAGGYDKLAGATAANDDHLPTALTVSVHRSGETTGWDAYDVWRRLIKDARERRTVEVPPFRR
jgi:hypothetical protein